MKHYWTVKQISKMTGLHLLTVYRHLREGVLPAKKIHGKLAVADKDLQTYLQMKGK